jgi:hypothetical protein
MWPRGVRPRPRSPINLWEPHTKPYISAYTYTSTHPDPRNHIPAHLLKAPFSQTHVSILRAWAASAPNAEQKRQVARIVEDVNRALNDRWSQLQGRVDVFGSCSWGGETGSEDGGKLVDLDLVYRVSCHLGANVRCQAGAEFFASPPHAGLYQAERM